MARIPEGRELIHCTVDQEVAELLRVKAALRRVTVGRLLDELVRQAYSRDSIVEEWSSGLPGMRKSRSHPQAAPAAPPFAGMRNSRPHPLANAPARPQEAPEDLAALWASLEAFQKSMGWTDGVLANQFGIAAPNVRQWRAKGAIARSQAPRAREVLESAQNQGE